MKIAIYGAGAAGCTIAAKIFKHNPDITLIARGEHGKALQENGLTYVSEDDISNMKIRTILEPLDNEKYDIIIIAVKAYSLPDIAPNISKMMHQETIIIPCHNGIPWWFLGDSNPHINLQHVAGGVFYMAARLEKAGIVHNSENPNFTIGKIKEFTLHQQFDKFVNLLDISGFRKPMTNNIYSLIFRKLCWNIVFNPLSIIHNKTSGQLAVDKDICDQIRLIINEVQNIADNLDIDFQSDTNAIIQSGIEIGNHPPSMLQDYRNNKPLEIDAILNAPIEIADNLGLAIPNIRKLKAQLENHLK